MAPDVYGLRLLGQPRMQRFALGLILGIVLLYRILQIAAWTGQIQWGYDFSAYWQAARNLVDGGLYSAAQLAGVYSPQQQFLYLYPPPFAVVFAPIAAIDDYRALNWLWFGLGLAIVIVSVLAVARADGLGGPTARWPLLRGRGAYWLVAGALALPPVVAELVLGNVHLEILGLLTLAWLGVRRGTRNGQVAAGAAIGIAALIKVFPGLLILWLLASRRYRAALAAVVAAGAVALVTLPVTGLQPWLDYPTVLANLGAPVDTTDTMAPTVWLAPALGFGLARVLVTAAGVLLAIGLGVRARRVRAGAASPEALAPAASPAALAASFGAAVAASVLIAPAVYQHYLAILVLPLLLGLAAGVRLRWLALAYVLLWGGQQPALGELAWVVNKGLPTAGALILLAVLSWRALSERVVERAAVREAVSG